MWSCRFVLVIGVLLPSLGLGCGAFETSKEFANSHFVDRPDPTDQGGDDWTADAGREGRGSKAREKDPDSWWKHFSSEKARSIERNVGVVYE